MIQVVAPLDFLHRFRRFRAPPGSPARAVGVPTAPGEELASELVPLFAQLDELEEETTNLLAAARERAEVELSEAAERADSIVAAARERAEDERARVAAEQRAVAQKEVAGIRAAAEQEAERVRRRAEERLPALVSAVVKCVELSR